MFSDIHPRPMCWNIWKHFVAEPPATKMAMLSRKFPAGKFHPGTFGWLCHVDSLFVHFGFVQDVFTTTSVPTCRASTKGPSALQEWQNLNSNNNWLRNTMCFGSILKLSLTNNLKRWRETEKLFRNLHFNCPFSWIVKCNTEKFFSFDNQNYYTRLYNV